MQTENLSKKPSTRELPDDWFESTAVDATAVVRKKKPSFLGRLFDPSKSACLAFVSLVVVILTFVYTTLSFIPAHYVETSRESIELCCLFVVATFCSMLIFVRLPGRDRFVLIGVAVICIATMAYAETALPPRQKFFEISRFQFVFLITGIATIASVGLLPIKRRLEGAVERGANVEKWTYGAFLAVLVPAAVGSTAIRAGAIYEWEFYTPVWALIIFVSELVCFAIIPLLAIFAVRNQICRLTIFATAWVGRLATSYLLDLNEYQLFLPRHIVYVYLIAGLILLLLLAAQERAVVTESRLTRGLSRLVWKPILPISLTLLLLTNFVHIPTLFRPTPWFDNLRESVANSFIVRQRDLDAWSLRLVVPKNASASFLKGLRHLREVELVNVTPDTNLSPLSRNAGLTIRDSELSTAQVKLLLAEFNRLVFDNVKINELGGNDTVGVILTPAPNGNFRCQVAIRSIGSGELAIWRKFFGNGRTYSLLVDTAQFSSAEWETLWELRHDKEIVLLQVDSKKQLPPRLPKDFLGTLLVGYDTKTVSSLPKLISETQASFIINEFSDPENPGLLPTDLRFIYDSIWIGEGSKQIGRRIWPIAVGFQSTSRSWKEKELEDRFLLYQRSNETKSLFLPDIDFLTQIDDQVIDQLECLDYAPGWVGVHIMDRKIIGGWAWQASPGILPTKMLSSIKFARLTGLSDCVLILKQLPMLEQVELSPQAFQDPSVVVELAKLPNLHTIISMGDLGPEGLVALPALKTVTIYDFGLKPDSSNIVLQLQKPDGTMVNVTRIPYGNGARLGPPQDFLEHLNVVRKKLREKYFGLESGR
ncbi:MAG: hypothetical protein ABL888_08630 [Pirellulaceae bacterium]